ncbi:MAG: tetratricopeptide repeat protein [Cyanosarcina radialis HA8281-LM2]|jgi:tetratricopeptide (TPR) repeat protein|nr:tetratricopeptide repeat protein [Cyanosarcina radialis HA8281-LM2]
MQLSLCSIVKNEEAALPQCLGSVKDIVDETIVLDTGSSDRTVEIAKEFGAKVYHFEWNNDFSAARNESLKYAQGEWILVLDADEVLVPEIVPALKQAIQSDRHILLNLVRQEVGATQSPYSLVSRLFRRHRDIYFSRPYHAIVDDSIAQLLQREPHWQIGYLPEIAMRHYGYQPGAIAAKDKLGKAQAGMEEFLATNPDDAYVCSKLGGLYVEIGNLERGIELLQHGLKAQQTDPVVLYELHYHLGTAYTHLPDLPQAIVNYKTAIQQPILPKLKLDAYNNLGNLLYEFGNFPSARKAYETALEIDPVLAIAYHNLGITLKAMGLLEEAIAAYKQAIELNPNYAETHQNLGVAMMRAGYVPESLAAFSKAISLHRSSNPQEGQRLQQSLREMGFQV